MEITSESRPREDLRWELLVLTPEKLQWLWERMQEFPQAFDDFSKGSFDDFYKGFLVRSNIFIDIGPGLGLGAGFGVRPGLDAVLHLVMFDKKLRGREWLFLDILGYFFDHLKLRRMTIIASDDNKTAIKLANRLGFKLEGTMRQSLLVDGKYIDQLIYGMLREELNAAVAA